MRSGLSRFAYRLGLTLLGVALFSGYAAFPALAFLPYVALVPWTLLYTDPRAPKVSSGYFVLAAYLSWLLCYKALFRFGWFAPPVMALFFLPAWWLFPLLMRPIQRLGLPRALTLPVVWVAVEWARLRFATSHFDLFALGYSQARFPLLVQIADVTGVYGISFLIAAFNGALADLLFLVRERGGRLAPALKARATVRSALAIGAAFLAVAGYGVLRLSIARNVPGPRLAVVQPNLRHTPSNALGTSLGQLFQTDEAVPPGTADLIVWPENAILDTLDGKSSYLEDLGWLAARKQAWILLGAQGRVDGQPGRSTNSAFLVDDRGAIRGRYDKQILFPWSEYVPLDAAVGLVSAPVQRAYRGLIRRAWGQLSPGMAGTRLMLLELPWNGGTIPFAALICVENTYPPLVAEAGRRGARFFVNITSEGTVGGVIQEQLLRVCMLRAIESGIAYVRCGNTGISGFIDPQGRLRSVLRNPLGGTISTQAERTEQVVLSSGGTTVYAASRDAFALLCVAAALALLLRAFVRGGPAMTPIPAPVAATALAGTLLLAAGCGGSVGAYADTCPDEATCRASLDRLAASWRAADAAEPAIAFLDHVVADYPSLAPEAKRHRAYFLERSGETVRALAEYEGVLAEHPTAGTYALLGNLNLRIGDAAAAVDALRQAARLAPGDGYVARRLALALWEAGDGEAARALALRIVGADPRQPDALTLLARIDLESGDLPGAMAALHRAASADPAHVESRYHLARLSWRAGATGDARRWLEELRVIEAALVRR